MSSPISSGSPSHAPLSGGRKQLTFREVAMYTVKRFHETQMLNQIMYTTKDRYKNNAVIAFSNRLVDIVDALPELSSFDAFFRVIDNVQWMPCLVDATNAFKKFVAILAHEHPEYIAGTSEMFDEPFKTNCRVYTYAKNDWDFVDGFPNGNPENRHNGLVFGPFADIKHVGSRVARDHYGSQAVPGRRLQVNGLHRVPVMTKFIAWDNQRRNEVKKATVQTDICSTNSGRKSGKVLNQAFQTETSATDSSLSAGALDSSSAALSADISRATPELYAQTLSTETEESTYPNSCVIICHDDTSDEDEESYEDRWDNSNLCSVIGKDEDSSMILEEDMPYDGHRKHIPDNSSMSPIGTTSSSCSTPQRLQPKNHPFRHSSQIPLLPPPLGAESGVSTEPEDSDSDVPDETDSTFEYSELGSRTLEYLRKHNVPIPLRPNGQPFRHKSLRPPLGGDRRGTWSREGSDWDVSDESGTSQYSELGSRTLEYLRRHTVKI